MGKPIAIALGVVGVKTPLPPEAVLAHAKPLQTAAVPQAEASAEPSRRRGKRGAAAPQAPGLPPASASPADGSCSIATEPSGEAVTAIPVSEGPSIVLTVPADGQA